MTTENEVRRTFMAVLEKKGDVLKGKTPAFEYQVKRPGMRFPDFVTWWPPRDSRDAKPPEATLGHSYTWTVIVKPKGEGKTGEYLDLVKIDEPEAPQTPASQPLPSLAHAEFRTPQQIMRGQALECVVRWAVDANETPRMEDVILRASKLAHFLETGDLLLPRETFLASQTPPQAPASQETAVAPQETVSQQPAVTKGSLWKSEPWPEKAGWSEFNRRKKEKGLTDDDITHGLGMPLGDWLTANKARTFREVWETIEREILPRHVGA